MKRLIAIGLSVLMLVGFSADAVAWDEADLDKLWKTNECPTCDLAGTRMKWANLKWANLTKAKLTGANLNNANLTGVNLTGADLTKANLYQANLTEANLTEANLTGANLTGVNLTGANLTGANLYQADLIGVRRCLTIMQDGSTDNSGCGAVATTVPSQTEGGTYTGESVDGRAHGQGTWTHPDGRKYIGEWQDDKKHGQGTYIFANGYMYVGEYKDGKRNGQGTLTHPDGYKYIGEWQDDKKHGQGTYTYPDGSKYVGEYKEGEEHGQAIFTRANGGKYIGGYWGGKAWEGIRYRASGEIWGTWSSGEWCKSCKPTARQLAIVRKINSGQIVVTPASPISTASSSSSTVSSGSTNVMATDSCPTWKIDSLTLLIMDYIVAETNVSSLDLIEGYCETSDSVTWGSQIFCKQQCGRFYLEKSAVEYALADKKHLKTASSTGSSSSSTTSTTAQTVQTTATQPSAVDKTAEIEFWKSVKDSTDPDMYREYLRQFPQGVYAGLAKIKLKKLGGTSTSVAQSSIPQLNYGDYYALVIGNNRYEHFRNLRTAVNDARTVSNLLKNDYGFEVTLLEDATRSQILDSIINLKNRVSRNDNVVVYYAGHGQLDPDTDEGFWIPVDANPDSQSNWLLTDRVRSQIKAMRAKHVMVVADSCFSGKFTRSAITRGLKIKPRSSEYVPALQRLIDKKSRTALTSGGLEPVLDSSSGGDHSVFADAFISILSDNEGVLDAAGLFSQLRPKVINNSDQTPEYSTIHQGGHDGGDFLFVRQ